MPKRFIPSDHFLAHHRGHWRGLFDALAQLRPEGRTGLALIDDPAFGKPFIRAACDRFLARERVLAHLAGCAPCRQEAAALRALKQRMHALGEATANTALTDRLVALGARDAVPGGMGLSRRRWPVRSIAAAFLTVAGLGLPAAAFMAGGGSQQARLPQQVAVDVQPDDPRQPRASRDAPEQRAGSSPHPAGAGTASVAGPALRRRAAGERNAVRLPRSSRPPDDVAVGANNANGTYRIQCGRYTVQEGGRKLSQHLCGH